jgi:hypothetical protein
LAKVFLKDRLDDHTVLLEVKWTAQDSLEFVAVFVRVRADLADLPSDHLTIPQPIRTRAIEAARDLVELFHSATEAENP